jgi:hypothetical protein
MKKKLCFLLFLIMGSDLFAQLKEPRIIEDGGTGKYAAL